MHRDAALSDATRRDADPNEAVTDTLLAIDDLTVAYRGGPAVLQRLSLTLERGHIGCVVGRSGCGKTTLLRAIAGFVPVAAGTITIDGHVVADEHCSAPPEKRGVGLVFQDYALFPHLSVEQNVAFGLRCKGGARGDVAARTAQMLELVGLASLAARWPHELSGGQQQRVALARALAPHPALLLMDEPFSSLDVELRQRLGQEVREILKASGTTAILVTHDQQEAFAIADRIGVMHEGVLEQWDRPYELYHRPATRFVADFIGQGVFLPARVLSAGTLAIELGELNGKAPASCDIGCAACGKGCEVEVLLRPDDVVHDDASPLKAQVKRRVFRGGDFIYTLQLPSGREVLALVPSHHDHAIGEMIGIRLDADHVISFNPREAAQGR